MFTPWLRHKHNCGIAMVAVTAAFDVWLLLFGARSSGFGGASRVARCGSHIGLEPRSAAQLLEALCACCASFPQSHMYITVLG